MTTVPVEKFVVVAFGFPIKFHTNLCGNWYSQVDLSTASQFLSEAEANRVAGKHNLTRYEVQPLAGRLPVVAR